MSLGALVPERSLAHESKHLHLITDAAARSNPQSEKPGNMESLKPVIEAAEKTWDALKQASTGKTGGVEARRSGRTGRIAGLRF